MKRGIATLLAFLVGLTFAPMAAGAALNVSVADFDPGIPGDAGLHRDLQIFPRIREVEALFLPFVLRETLVRSGDWGAVRVVPEASPGMELVVSGTIVQSDGEHLEIRVLATDASGREWLNETYAHSVLAPQRLYDQVAADLAAAQARLTADDLARIRDVSLMRYAVELAPDAFADYLQQDDGGNYSLRRLPARNDPLLERIERIRSTEYVITDAVDAKYRELHAEIASVYAIWREYRRKVLAYEAQDAARAASTRNAAQRGSYEWLRNQYDNYKYHRVTAQEQDRLAVAFNNEVGPKVLAMEERIGELRGWVEDKYAEWQWRLEELIEAEAEANAPSS